MQWLAARVVPMEDAVPDIMCGFCEPEQLTILGIDHPFINTRACKQLPGCAAEVGVAIFRIETGR
jgi:hypothetical protein